MNKLILSLSLLLIPFSALFSQDILNQKSSEQDGYWNMAFTGGVLFNFIDKVDDNNKSHAGYIAGFDLFYKMRRNKTALVISASYGRNKRRNTVELTPNSKPYIEYYMITIGPRFYLGNNYFVETNFGEFILDYTSGKSGATVNEQNSSILKGGAFMCLGAGATAGKLFKMSRDFDAVVKGSINIIDPGKYIIFGGLNAGIIFNNKYINPETEKYSKNGVLSASLFGGINNPELFHSGDFEIGKNIGAEIAYRSTPKIEIYGTFDYNQISRKNPSVYGSGSADIILGPRFIIGHEKYLSFFELGMGLYLQDNQYDYYSENSGPFVGLNFGTGLIFNLNEHIGIPIKGKMHVIFNGAHSLGSYVTAVGGLRYTL